MRVLIFGLGGVGTAILHSLYGKADITVFDKDREVCDRVAENYDVEVYNMDMLDIYSLDEMDMDFDVAFVTTSNYDENVILGLYLVSRGIPKVLVRVSTEKYAHVIERFGIIPLAENVTLAKEFIEIAFTPMLKEFFSTTSHGGEVLEYDATEEEVGKTVRDLFEEGKIVLGIKRKEQFLFPSKDDTVEIGDRLLVVKGKD